MYGQGNYGPQFGQGSETPMSQFQHRPVVPPPPPPPPFQQGPPASQPSLIQQGPPSIPPHIVPSGPALYQHAPPPPAQQGPTMQVPTSGMLNAGQSYLLPPPPPPQQFHGNTSMAHTQQNSQWTHNMHHIPPPVPPPLGPSSSEMCRQSLPPRILPTPSQGQTPHRGPIHLQQPDSVQGTQQIPLPPPPPPPPPTSSFFNSAPFGSFVHSAHQDPMALPPPPPLPSSPPPLPPSPPPPTSPPPFGALSSTPLLTAFDLSCNSKSGPTSNHSGFKVMASDSVNEVVVSTQIRDDAPVFDDYKNFEGMTSCEVGSIMKDDLSSVEGTKLDLPPPKPVEEKVVRKIEILCHFIAKNGRGFEDMARQKELGNPEFEFLFGGEPGSEAAVAHEYFEWMKKKCILQHEHSNSALGPSDVGTLTQTNFLMDAGVSHSPTDSDMDMEDDITQPDEEQRVYTSFESLNPETVLIPKELDIREQLCASQNADEYSHVKDNASRSSGLDGQEKGFKLFPDHDHFTFGRSLSKVDSSVTNSDGSPSNSDVEKSSVPLLEDLTQSNVSEAAGGVRSEKFPGELVKGASPFRLLQDYASDDSSEDDEKPGLEDVSPVTASPLTTAGATSLHGDIGSNLRTDPASKNLSSSEMAFGILSESVVACPSSMPSNAWDFPPESLRNARKTTITSIATVKTEEMVGNNSENKVSIKNAASSEALQQKDAFDGVDAAAAASSAAESVKSQSRKEDVKNTSTLPKVDEFGRLVREGASDSDSDESRYTGRRGKRGRSWSRSRSPHDRRRKSPRRRRVKRSRSRSWSPKKRSRSRSPTYRRRGESGGDKMRWNRSQPPACFDFLRGRCHRGAFCRYVHDIDKSDGARHYRSKHQYLEVPPVSRTSDFHEEIEKTLPKRSVHEQDMPESSFGALKDENMDGGKILVSVQTRISNQDDKSLVAEVAKSERSVEVTAVVQDTRDIKEEIQESFSGCPDHENSISGRPDHENCPEQIETVQPVDGSPSCLLTDDVGAPTSPGDTAHGIALVEKLVIPHPQANLSLPVLQNTDYHSQYADDCSTSEFSQVQKSTTFQNQLSVSEPLLNKISSVQNHGTGSINQSFSSQSLPPKEFTPVILPAVDFPVRHLHLPPPPPSFSQGTSIPHVPQLPREHDLMQPTLKFSSLSPHMENCPPYQGSMQNQNSHFAMPPNYSWSLPPPPPLPSRPSFVNNSAVNAATAMQGVPSLQFQQNQLPPRNDLTSLTFLRPYPHELPAHSQVGEFHHHNYSLMQGPEPPQPSLHMKDFRPKTLPMSNPVSQPFGSTGLVGEDHFSQFLVQGLNPPNSFAHSNIPPQPLPSLRDSASRTMQSFPGDNLSSGRFFSSSPQNHTYLQHQRPLYGLQRPSADGLAENLGDYGNINPSLSRYTSDILDKNQPSHLSDFGGSRISNYYNPYASTFDQPLRSKFSSNVFNPEKDMPHSNLGDAPYSLSHVPADGHGVGSLGSRHMKSSPKSSRPADLPRSGSDQYDPLFDSIEPSENSLKKFDYDLKHQPTGSQKLLDVEEKRKKDVGVVMVTTSVKSENDEYGETADAEVGDVDNASASNPLDATNTSAGEIEIDQIKTPGKSKKSKDSRSMKLFKVALADFVKEVLKPSWRQGSMSKEAFKTIVKKTIDKVSGAMKSHQIPKSQAKINHYIDSSQRKLTKLVMGYVQKYVKV